MPPAPSVKRGAEPPTARPAGPIPTPSVGTEVGALSAPLARPAATWDGGLPGQRLGYFQVPVVQEGLVIGPPGDLHEREADQIADEVVRHQGPPPRERHFNPLWQQLALRAPAHRVASEPEQAYQPRAEAVANLGPGEPLDAGTLAFMGPRFNRNFSQVRVHTDSLAAESARSVNALAYTVGRDVVFGAGQYAPTTPSGQRLLAHELTHVVQQRTTGRRRLDRQPATKPTERFETDIPILPAGTFETWAAASFWVQRVSGAFNLLSVPGRFKDEEERDAVLATLWSVRPSPDTLRSTQTKYVRIPTTRRSTKQPRELLYRFVFEPKQVGQTKGTVEIHFEAEDPKSVFVGAPQPPADYDPDSAGGGDIGGSMQMFHLHFEGFPGGRNAESGEPEYWKQHPKEKTDGLLLGCAAEGPFLRKDRHHQNHRAQGHGNVGS